MRWWAVSSSTSGAIPVHFRGIYGAAIAAFSALNFIEIKMPERWNLTDYLINIINIIIINYLITDFKVSAEGYGSQEVVFDVSGDEATELNVTLRHPAVSTSTTISSIRTTLPTASASTFSSGDELRSGRQTNPTNPAEIIPEITVMVDYDVIQTDYDIEFDDIRMGQAVKSAGCVVWRPPILLLFLCHISFRLLWSSVNNVI